MVKVNARKRGQDCWQYYFDLKRVDGKRRKKTKSGFKTKDEALKAGTIAYNEYYFGNKEKAQSNMTYGELLDEWMNEQVNYSRNRQTELNYKKLIRNYVKPELGNKLLKEIKPGDIQKLVNKMIAKKYSYNTIKNVFLTISASFKYAVDIQEYLDRNPTKKVNIPNERIVKQKQVNSHPNVFLQKEIIDKIFERFTEDVPQHYLTLLFAYRCGMRSGEIFGLAWDDIDFKNHTLRIERQLQYDTEKKEWYYTIPKYNSCRVIYLDNFMIDVLKRIKKKHDNERESKDFYKYYVNSSGSFTTDNRGKEFDMIIRKKDTGFASSNIKMHIAEVIHNDLGIKEYTLHSLRHTHATELKDAGVDSLYIAQRLGHKSLKETMKYTHTSDVNAKRSEELINNMHS